MLKYVSLYQISGGIENDEINEKEELKTGKELVRIPSDIKPYMVPYRVEIVFWGVRDLKKVQLLQITKPKITLQIFDLKLHSNTIANVKKNLNFLEPVKFLDLVSTYTKIKIKI